MKKSKMLYVLLLMLFFTNSKCVIQNNLYEKTSMKGIIVLEYKFIPKHQTYWYNKRYFINKTKNTIYPFSHKIVSYGDSCNTFLSSLKKKDVDFKNTIYSSSHYKDYTIKKQGFHIGGDLYHSTNNNQLIYIAFKIEGKGYLIKDDCFHFSDDDEEIPCEYGEEISTPYFYINKVNKTFSLEKDEIDSLKFKKYPKNEFLVGYCR